MANYARNHVCFLFSARVHYLVQAVDKVIFSVNIATTSSPSSQELQTNLEISVCGGEMYIDLKN